MENKFAFGCILVECVQDVVLPAGPNATHMRRMNNCFFLKVVYEQLVICTCLRAGKHTSKFVLFCNLFHSFPHVASSCHCTAFNSWFEPNGYAVGRGWRLLRRQLRQFLFLNGIWMLIFSIQCQIGGRSALQCQMCPLLGGNCWAPACR